MAAPLSERIRLKIREAAELYHRLILVVGPPRSGKTIALQELAADDGRPLLNVNLNLSRVLLELSHRQRAVQVPRRLADLADSASSDIVLLDNIELLFSTELAQDPIRLLQGLSRNRTIVATWPGAFDGTYLTYAEPGHPEARRYTRPEAIVVCMEEHSAAQQEYNPA